MERTGTTKEMCKKGYGVFAKRSFKKHDFLAEYVGDLVNEEEAEKREQVYSRRNRRRKYPRCYMFFVKHNQMTWCIDATNTSGRVGNMVNDSCTDACANCKMKKLIIDGNLHLAIFATRDIKINEELLYDYGDDSQNYWWRMPETAVDLNEVEPDNVPDVENNQSKVMDCENSLGTIEKTTEPDNVPDVKNNQSKVMDCENSLGTIEKTTEPDNVPDVKNNQSKVMDCENSLGTIEKTAEPDNVPDVENNQSKVMDCENSLGTIEKTTEPDNVPEVENNQSKVMDCENSLGTIEKTTEPDNVPDVENNQSKVMDCENSLGTIEKTTEPDNVPDVENNQSKVMDCENSLGTIEKTTEVKYDDENEMLCDLESDQEYVQDMCTDDKSGQEYVQDMCTDDKSDQEYVPDMFTDDKSDQECVPDMCSDDKSDQECVPDMCSDDKSDQEYVPDMCTDDESDQEYVPDMCTDDESDQEYVPDSESHDDDDRDSNCSLTVPLRGQSVKHCSKDDEIVIQASQTSSSSTSTISVSSTRNEAGKRIWDKRNACLYCSLFATNIGRHLIRKHSSEAMVAKALTHAKKTKYRQKEFKRIRHLGNFYHNAKVLTTKVGTLLVVKRPPKNIEVAAEDYAPCIYCKGYYIAVELWRHYRECKFQEEDISKFESGCNQKGGLRASRMLKESLSLEKKDTNNTLFDTMRMDSIGIICKTDDIISELGRNLLAAKGIDHINYIRAKMREAARLLLKVREKGEGKDNLSVQDTLKPNMFDLVIDCVHLVCSYISQKGDQCPKYEIPSLALKIGHTLRKCAYLKQSTCIKSSDKEGENEAESFLKLMDIEYTPKVSAIALSTLNTQRQRNVKPLPVTEDIVKFSSFINTRMTTLCDDLNTADTDSFQTVYYSLAKVTAAQIITFNKRRSGEVAKMLITDFTQRREVRSEGTNDVFKMLSKPEQKLSERLDLMHIKGKRGRIVPIILTKDATKSLQHLVNMMTRKKAGVVEDNIYAFPLSRSSLNNIRGCDALAEVVRDADLNHPETFKSTNLRKYVATVSQVLNMKENEIDWLASHLGHNINVHRHFYRLQEQHVELAKIAKLLLAVDQGKTHLCAGKSLNDLPIEDIRDVQNNDFDEDDEDDCVVDDEDIGVVVDDNDESGNVDESFDVDCQNACLSDSGEKKEIGPSVDRDNPENKKQYDGKKRPQKTGKSCRHQPWTSDEKQFVLEEFHSTITKGTIVGVGKKLIEMKMRKGGDRITQRTWVQVKSCIKNIIDKNKKDELKMERRKLFKKTKVGLQ